MFCKIHCACSFWNWNSFQAYFIDDIERGIDEIGQIGAGRMWIGMQRDDAAVSISLDNVGIERVIVWMDDQRQVRRTAAMPGPHAAEVDVKDGVAVENRETLV